MKKVIIPILALGLFFGTVSCRETTKEGEEIELSDDDGDVENALERAADETEDAVKRAGEEVKGAADDVKEELDGDIDDN